MNTQAQCLDAQAADAVLQLEYDLVEMVREEMGWPEAQAYPLAKALVRGMRKRYGGLRIGGRGAAIYIPAPSKEERNEAIRREFDGTNRDAVMAKFGIKRTQLYRIVSQRPGAARIGVSSAKVPFLDKK
ncbi:Mor transcription activator family protein [Delftia acidovorans]|uniref:Mor transcription activator family protein n=1 Tax=Delftia acidovorans TaxID=80866 RepID=UPI000F84E072|nr:Mor transcription activator family protein [Delftia acidovorans]